MKPTGGLLLRKKRLRKKARSNKRLKKRWDELNKMLKKMGLGPFWHLTCGYSGNLVDNKCPKCGENFPDA